eukprot:jgi/Tetstr1/454182/TSEL_041101.t1
MGRPTPCCCCDPLVWDGVVPPSEFQRLADGCRGGDVHMKCLQTEHGLLSERLAEEVPMGARALDLMERGVSEERVRAMSLVLGIVASGRHAELGRISTHNLRHVFALLVACVRHVGDWNAWMREHWERHEYGELNDYDMPFYWNAIRSRGDPALEAAFLRALCLEMEKEYGYSREQAAAHVEQRLSEFGPNF